jgi:hypothetical protein
MGNVSVTSWVLESLEFVAFVRKCDRKFTIGVKFEVILVSFLCRKNILSLIWVWRTMMALMQPVCFMYNSNNSSNIWNLYFTTCMLYVKFAILLTLHHFTKREDLGL